MMFLNQKGNTIFRVTLSIDKVLEPFWSLSKNLIGEALLKNRDYRAFNSDFQESLAKRLEECDAEFNKRCDVFEGTEPEKQRFIEEEDKSRYDQLYDEAFRVVRDAYMEGVLKNDCFAKGIKKSCSLVVYHPSGECRFVTEGDASNSFEEDFQKCLSKAKILETFLDFLDKSIASAYTFDKSIYNSALPDNPRDESVSIASPLYLMALLAAKAGVERCDSEYKIWFNEAVLEKLGYAMPQDGSVYAYKNEERIVGLEQGQYFIPLSTDWKEYFDISDPVEFAWTDYKNQVFVKPPKDKEKKEQEKTNLTHDEQAFIVAAKTERFTNLLSYLEDNLYLSDDAPEIPGEYTRFFQTLVKIEDLKHLPDYKLFVPDQESDTVLGVYKINREKGETSYNLRHMLSMKKREDDRIVKDCYDAGNKKASAVSTLLPQYAPFYNRYYYEFFLEAVLKDLKEQGVIEGFLRNQHYAYNTPNGAKQCEIDAIVKTGSKIIILELKTTLHVEFLVDYPQRYAAMLQAATISDLYEFYLISSFADKNIEVLNYPEEEGYNTARAGLKTVPYRFDVKIPGTAKKLHCLSESSYDKLKAELTRVFTA